MKDIIWLQYCRSCKRKHRVRMTKCPSCGGRGGYTPQPVSDKVCNKCKANYECDGCKAYKEHLYI